MAIRLSFMEKNLIIIAEIYLKRLIECRESIRYMNWHGFGKIDFIV